MIPVERIAVLSCPCCRGDVHFVGRLDAEHVTDGEVHCARCSRHWPVENGMPRFIDDRAIGGVERLMRLIYDNLAALHDPSSRLIMPALQFVSEAVARDRYMPRLELALLTPRADGSPVRILEVGVGTGANLALVKRDLPTHLDVEIWGLDLSVGMLEQCRRRLRHETLPPVRLVLGDAHCLPFRDGEFDRVFHVGGIGGYRDQARGLAEMARVARRGTPIVVVDEQLDPSRGHCLYHRLAFRALTFYDSDPKSPVELLPKAAADVIDEQITRFYYSLSFRMPG